MSSRLHALALALSLIAIASVVASYEVAERRLDLIQTRLEAVEAKLEKPSAFPVQLVDSLGRSVVIVNEPKRIVSIAPSTTEILFAIGAGEKVVGVDRFSNYPPDVVELARAGKIQYVGDFINPSIETILKLRPDLVVGTGGVQARHIEALASRGLTVLALDAENLEELYRCILLLGVATGESERARALVEELKAHSSRACRAERRAGRRRF
ncbi:MAG: ABC transporter substrate-binding protein [Fervidicoccaceae archaeon]